MQWDRESLANKQKKTQHDQFDQNVKHHLDALGIDGVAAYQQWCAAHGFSRRLKKTQAERRKERDARVACRAEVEQRAHRRTRFSRHETVARVLAGELQVDDVTDKHHRSLCVAVQRLRGLADAGRRQRAMAAFTKLYGVCKLRRVKFLTETRPAMPERAFRSCTYLEALAALAAYHENWQRPLEDWKCRTHNQRRQFESLASHLLVAHSMPAFFYAVWFQRDVRATQPELDAFVHVGAGHSIRKADIPLPYSKRMSHHFLLAPKTCSFPEALRWGQVLGLGGDPALAQAVLSSFLGSNFANDAFWLSVIEWFIKYPMFDRNLFGVVADYLNQQKFGFGNPLRVAVGRNGGRRELPAEIAQPHLSMKGRTPDALLRSVERWHRQLQIVGRGKYQLVWKHSLIRELDLTEGERESTRWTIRQLLSSEALVDEGRQMNHCVASYARSCHSGRTSIWTLRRERKGTCERRLTVEVRLDDRTICQARGKCNRMPTSAETSVLRRWAQIADLRLR